MRGNSEHASDDPIVWAIQNNSERNDDADGNREKIGGMRAYEW